MVVSSFVAGYFGHSARSGAAKSPVRAELVGLKMPDFARYDGTLWNRIDDVASVRPRGLPGRPRFGVERLHQVRAGLGRLASGAEIVQTDRL
jgi:hypothetical protein